ncbi:MAG TPA: hypothetical protein VGP72_12615 [Planctomycetota bacterium]|jgi:hypothetical protein
MMNPDDAFDEPSYDDQEKDDCSYELIGGDHPQNQRAKLGTLSAWNRKPSCYPHLKRREEQPAKHDLIGHHSSLEERQLCLRDDGMIGRQVGR